MRLQEVIFYVSMGVEAKRNGEYNKAFNYYNKALNIDPYDYEALYARAKINYILGDYEKSIEDYATSVIVYVNELNENADVQSAVKSIGQIALHCGHSILAKLAYSKNMSGIIELSKVYRKSIDPYYMENSNPINCPEKDYRLFELKCLDEGISYFNELNYAKLTPFINVLVDFLNNEINSSKENCEDEQEEYDYIEYLNNFIVRDGQIDIKHLDFVINKEINDMFKSNQNKRAYKWSNHVLKIIIANLVGLDNNNSIYPLKNLYTKDILNRFGLCCFNQAHICYSLGYIEKCKNFFCVTISVTPIDNFVEFLSLVEKSYLRLVKESINFNNKYYEDTNGDLESCIKYFTLKKSLLLDLLE